MRDSSVIGGRRPLAESERAYFEPRFGIDFSQVRVHTDARAYTLGRDVVFGAEQYAPGKSEGRRLMAHELTHVVQQQNLNESQLARYIDAWAPGMNQAEERPVSNGNKLKQLLELKSELHSNRCRKKSRQISSH